MVLLHCRNLFCSKLEGVPPNNETQLPPFRWGSFKHFFYLNQYGLVEKEVRRSVLAEGITKSWKGRDVKPPLAFELPNGSKL